MTDLETARRWRLILGRYADRALDQAALNPTDARLEKTLDYLYNREYQRRGHVQGGRGGSSTTAS